MRGIAKVFSKEDCAKINTIFKQHSGEVVSYSKLLNLLSPVENTVAVIQKFTNFHSPIIQKIGRGKYRIPMQPIYLEKMQNAWDYKGDKKKEDPIEKAIHLLKENDYKVLQKDFDLDGALKSPDKPVNEFIKWIEL